MKKVLFMFIAVLGFTTTAFAQKFALVDMEYILTNIPAYEMANEQLNQTSQRWQKEVEAIGKQAETLYKNYQANMVFLTDDQKKKAEEEVMNKEKEAATLRNKYFGPEGSLYKMRQQLMQPIQDDVYNAIKQISDERGYMCIFDRASAADIIFASPRIDISNEVLTRLGYSK